MHDFAEILCSKGRHTVGHSGGAGELSPPWRPAASQTTVMRPPGVAPSPDSKWRPVRASPYGMVPPPPATYLPVAPIVPRRADSMPPRPRVRPPPPGLPSRAGTPLWDRNATRRMDDPQDPAPVKHTNTAANAMRKCVKEVVVASCLRIAG
jgi:hypothetical protein